MGEVGVLLLVLLQLHEVGEEVVCLPACLHACTHMHRRRPSTPSICALRARVPWAHYWSATAAGRRSVCPPRLAVHSHAQVEENKGMAMIYTLVTAAKEWLRGGECSLRGSGGPQPKAVDAGALLRVPPEG